MCSFNAPSPMSELLSTLAFFGKCIALLAAAPVRGAHSDESSVVKLGVMLVAFV